MRKFILVGLIVFVSVLLGFQYLRYSDQRKYDKILTSCPGPTQAKYSECVGNKLIYYANANPAQTGKLMSYIYANARQKHQIDLRYFSDYTHYAGMALADKPISLSQAAEYCGNSFKGGCFHGFVMQKLDAKDVRGDALNKLANFCEPLAGDHELRPAYINCLHGVGHEIWAKGQTNILQALSYCDSLSKQSFKDACWSGVLMEYSKSGVSKGYHSHSPVSTIDLPCAQLKLQHQPVCYASIGSYGQYYPNKEPLQVTKNRCKNNPESYVEVCINAINERLMLAVGKLTN